MRRILRAEHRISVPARTVGRGMLNPHIPPPDAQVSLDIPTISVI